MRVTASVRWGSWSELAELVLLRAFGGMCDCGGALAAGHQRLCVAWGEGGEAEAKCAGGSSSSDCQNPIKSNCSAFKR
jgi:hypothetical protein